MPFRIAIALLSGLMLISAYAQIYESKDEKGNPSFSDVPKESAKELKLPPVNVVPATKSLDVDFEFNQPSINTVKYRTLEIIAPKNDETVFINTDNMRIEVRLVPPVRRELGHRLRILFDSEVIAENDSSYLLDDADRGMHIVSAQVVDEKGDVIMNSKPVTVHIRKPSAHP